jgi:aspartate/methionine/tyrosine aminotransferase
MGYPLKNLPVTIGDLEINGSSTYGYQPLQEALAKFCGTTPGHVFAGIGTSLANHIAIATMVAPGEAVLLEDPTYELILSTAGYLGADIHRFPRREENGFRIDPDDIRRRMVPSTKLIIITNLHNPTSVMTDANTLKEIGQIAEKAGAHVIVDEVYLDAAFGKKVTSALHLGPEFIVTSSLTKVYGLSGLRCGWVLAQPELITRMWRLNDLFSSITAHPAELLSVIALQEIKKISAWSEALLSTNRRLLEAFLAAHPELETVNPGIGTVVFPKLTTGNVDRLCDILMKEYSTTIAPGRFFGMPDHFRIGIGIRTDLLQQGLENLGKALIQAR